VAPLWVLPTPHVIFAISPNWENCLKTHLLSRRGFVIPSFMGFGVEMQKLSKVKLKIYFPFKPSQIVMLTMEPGMVCTFEQIVPISS